MGNQQCGNSLDRLIVDFRERVWKPRSSAFNNNETLEHALRLLSERFNSPSFNYEEFVHDQISIMNGRNLALKEQRKQETAARLTALLEDFRDRVWWPRRETFNKIYLGTALARITDRFDSPAFNYEEFVACEIEKMEERRVQARAIVFDFDKCPEDNPLSDRCAVCHIDAHLLVTGCRHVVCRGCMEKVSTCPVCRKDIDRSLVKKKC